MNGPFTKIMVFWCQIGGGLLLCCLDLSRQLANQSADSQKNCNSGGQSDSPPITKNF